MEKLISRKEAAKLLGISLDRLDQARSSGMIAYIQYVENGNVFFTNEAIEEYVARCTHRAGCREALPTIRKRRVPKKPVA